jgi:hypothetical protein
VVILKEWNLPPSFGDDYGKLLTTFHPFEQSNVLWVWVATLSVDAHFHI